MWKSEVANDAHKYNNESNTQRSQYYEMLERAMVTTMGFCRFYVCTIWQQNTPTNSQSMRRSEARLSTLFRHIRPRRERKREREGEYLLNTPSVINAHKTERIDRTDSRDREKKEEFIIISIRNFARKRHIPYICVSLILVHIRACSPLWFLFVTTAIHRWKCHFYLAKPYGDGQ